MNQDGQPNLCRGLPVCQFPDRVCPWKAVDLDPPRLAISNLILTDSPFLNVDGRQHIAGSPRSSLAAEAAQLIMKDPQRRWTLPGLAQMVHISSAQLGRLFMQTFARSPMQFVSAVRVTKMAVLLVETDWPISSIGKEVGWHDRRYATRRFQALTGMSPSSYRKRYVMEHPERV